MRTASRTTIIWFLSLSAAYILVCYGLRGYVPAPLICNAQALFYSSIFGLVATYCILVGAAGSPIPLSRDEHPVSFWTIVGCAVGLAIFFALCGIEVIHTPCPDTP